MNETRTIAQVEAGLVLVESQIAELTDHVVWSKLKVKAGTRNLGFGIYRRDRLERQRDRLYAEAAQLFGC